MKNDSTKPVNGCKKEGRKYLNISLIWNYDHHIFCIPIGNTISPQFHVFILVCAPIYMNTASHAHFCMKTVK